MEPLGVAKRSESGFMESNSVYKRSLNLLKDMIRDIFEEDEGVKIVLFGSRARGDYTRVSDIDVGILLGEDETNRRKFILLEERVENSNIPYKVDLVNLSQTSEEFREKALREGISWKNWESIGGSWND